MEIQHYEIVGILSAVFSLCSSLIYLGIKRQLDKRDKQEAIIEELRNKAIEAEDTVTKQWRQTFQDNLCLVKKIVEDIRRDMLDKVSEDRCTQQHREVWEAVKDIRDKQYHSKFKLDV